VDGYKRTSHATPFAWRLHGFEQLDRTCIVDDFDCRFSIYEKMGDRLFDSTFTLCYTLSATVGIVICYQVWLNVACIVINVPAIVYLLKSNFTGKFG
jgi:hypothetical protein